MPKAMAAHGKAKKEEEDEGPPSVALLDMYANAAETYRSISLQRGNPAMLSYPNAFGFAVPQNPYAAAPGAYAYPYAYGFPRPHGAMGAPPQQQFQRYAQQPYPFAHPDSYQQQQQRVPPQQAQAQARVQASYSASRRAPQALVHAYGSAATRLADEDALARSALLASQRRSGATPRENEAARQRSSLTAAQRHVQLQLVIDKAFKAGQLVERFGGAAERATADDVGERPARGGNGSTLSDFDGALSARFAGLTQREVEQETAAMRRSRMPPNAVLRGREPSPSTTPLRGGLSGEQHSRRYGGSNGSHVDPDELDAHGDRAVGTSSSFGGSSATANASASRRAATRFGRPPMVDVGTDAARSFEVDAATAPVDARTFRRSSALAGVAAQRLERALHVPPTPTTAATVLTRYIPAGVAQIHVASAAGWEAGMMAVLNVGAPNEERLFIVGSIKATITAGATLLTADPTQRAHGVSEAIIDVRARERLARTQQRNLQGLPGSGTAQQRVMARTAPGSRLAASGRPLQPVKLRAVERRPVTERETHAASPGWQRRKQRQAEEESKAYALWQRNEWEKWQQRRQRATSPPSPRRHRSLHAFRDPLPEPEPEVEVEVAKVAQPTDASAATPQGRWRTGFAAALKSTPVRSFGGAVKGMARAERDRRAAAVNAVIAAAAGPAAEPSPSGGVGALLPHPGKSRSRWGRSALGKKAAPLSAMWRGSLLGGAPASHADAANDNVEPATAMLVAASGPAALQVMIAEDEAAAAEAAKASVDALIDADTAALLQQFSTDPSATAATAVVATTALVVATPAESLETESAAVGGGGVPAPGTSTLPRSEV